MFFVVCCLLLVVCCLLFVVVVIVVVVVVGGGVVVEYYCFLIIIIDVGVIRVSDVSYGLFYTHIKIEGFVQTIRWGPIPVQNPADPEESQQQGLFPWTSSAGRRNLVCY